MKTYLAIATLSMSMSTAFATSFADRCANLIGTSVNVKGSVSAEVIDAAIETIDPQTGASVNHCKVLAHTITENPYYNTDTSTVVTQLRLPEVWNKRMFMTGDGGLAGEETDENFMTIPIGLNGSPLSQLFATVTTNSGHANMGNAFSAQWALDVPASPGWDNQKEVNYATQGVHLSVVTAKKVIKKFYHRKPKYSYFHGCSNGGRQALIEATQFPRDFDGIIAGAPGNSYPDFFGRAGIIQKQNLLLDHPLSEAQMNEVTRLVLEKCDLDDGVPDGILSNPTRCKFDYQLELPICAGPPTNTCYTQAQVDLIDLIGSDQHFTNPKSLLRGYELSGEGGDALLSGFLHGWSSWHTGTPGLGGANISLLFLFNGTYPYVMFDDPQFDSVGYLLSSSDQDLVQDAQVLNGTDVKNANIRRFAKKGGKLLMYHGWIDQALPPRDTIAYFNQIKQFVRGNTDKSARLFMVPGMAHCAFGPGASLFDGIAAISDWVEKGKKPDAMTAVSFPGYPQISRPLCKYPTEAVYKGGDDTLASSYKCKKVKNDGHGH